MWELPTYIRIGVGFSREELEMLIGSICKEQDNVRMADRFIQMRLTEYEIKMRSKCMVDGEMDDYKCWKMVETYFEMHKFSFERQYFKRKLWE